MNCTLVSKQGETFMFEEIMSNRILVAGATSWALAQILKTLVNFIDSKKVKAERLIGRGGFPSSHSAFVTSILISTGRVEGVGTTAFALAFALAVVVMYDAMGVRRAAGEQAKTLNWVVDQLEDNHLIGENNSKVLKEFLGHTPIEVLGGAVLGALIGALV